MCVCVCVCVCVCMRVSNKVLGKVLDTERRLEECQFGGVERAPRHERDDARGPRLDQNHVFGEATLGGCRQHHKPVVDVEAVRSG